MFDRQGRRQRRGQGGFRRDRRPSLEVIRETTAPSSFVQRIGAEDAEMNAASLKPRLSEDAGDTKD